MHKKRVEARGLISGILLPMGLICLFAFCSLALALTGGTAYRNIQGQITNDYDSIVASNYLRTKLSQNNTSGLVSLREEDGTQVLAILSYDSDGTAYETRIYMHEGGLMESYTLAERSFSPIGGTRIAELAACTFSIGADGLFEAVITTPGGSITRSVFALAQGGGA